MQINIKTTILLMILFLLSGVASVVKSQNVVNPDSALQGILNKLEGSNLSLSTAKEYALKNATSVRSAEALYLAAKGSLRKERGSFDPELYFSLNYQDLREPTASFFAGADVLVTEQTNS